MPLSTRYAFPAVLAAVLLAGPACKKDAPDSHGDPGTAPSAPVTQAAHAGTPAGSANPDAKKKHDEEVALHFAETDKDGDGKVTREETKAVADAKFAEVDRNKDGLLDAAELSSQAEQEFARQATARIRELDKNGDGRLTRDEAAPGMLAHFEKYDADGDGAITLEEVMKLTSPRGGRARQSPLAALDTDGDGVVSAQEHDKARLEWFDRADSNHDGVVTLDEATAAVPTDRGRPGVIPRGLGQ